jgi:hypothetical protein
MTRNSARTLNDNAALEQQASLVMMQIGQQISQAGAINAYLANTDPDATNTSTTSGSGYITFDTRTTGINPANPAASVYGTHNDGTPDTLTISYTAPNDNSTQQVRNCIGNLPTQTPPDGPQRVVSIFSVNPNTHDLMCGNEVASSTRQPIASNVVDMQVKYLSVQENDNVLSQDATQVNQSPVNWSNINGIQVCLEMQGDVTQAPQQNLEQKNCQGNSVPGDGRIHRILRQTFYLRNN